MAETPKCPKCGQPCEKTTTLKASKPGEKLEVDAYVCLADNYNTAVKRVVNEKA